MSLLTKLEKLEKLAESKAKSEAHLVDPKLLAAISRVFDETAALDERRAKLPLHELVAELRSELAERVKDNEHKKTHPEQYLQAIDLFGDDWNWMGEYCEETTRAKLAELTARAAKLS